MQTNYKQITYKYILSLQGGNTSRKTKFEVSLRVIPLLSPQVRQHFPLLQTQKITITQSSLTKVICFDLSSHRIPPLQNSRFMDSRNLTPTPWSGGTTTRSVGTCGSWISIEPGPLNHLLLKSRPGKVCRGSPVYEDGESLGSS